MKRPKTQMPRRPITASASVARTPKEAAIRLVRLEFDVARLEMGLRQAQERADIYSQELARTNEQRQELLSILNS